MIKKIGTFVLACAWIFTYSAEIELVPDSLEYGFNSGFRHDLSLSESEVLRGFYLELYYDTSLILIDSIVKAPALSGFMNYKIEKTNGRIIVASVQRGIGSINFSGNAFSIFGTTRSTEGVLQYTAAINRVNLIDAQNSQIPCTFTIPAISINPGSMAEKYAGASSLGMAISPNPVNGPMTISFNTLDKVSTVKVFDIQGKMIETIDARKKQYVNGNVSAYSSGCYFAVAEANQKQFIKSFIVRR
ncbi:MAG: hypothetical protein A2487_14675 [Candidatus Raymondbacteria bacterium RifOxyC12_full_50_8]|uniref:Secretion system C-terminal sorting domain-containing protein n=1 Tax=Candidatus Raymondbacteria bacterium RIFOXYD12_FULL_49_13 TaxID=1817890 RepID=A0A1F7FL45_UNCRA|nr:MAG: hypothetical protein A2487_14675 [Candidatus Raymondbacteria bacterium RifOxyC12_full_50_8]OGK07439.1 MAG: hypothetical protein A2519_11110 [Candidatus Raymondbacteria bacterium RIFOXYD12_FULL_49_13]